MILAEFPVLYNYQDYKFTPQEYGIWHRNTLTDAAGWMSRLWNHPSVMMWVLSNESTVDNKWEETVFQDFVKRLDPTRPAMRTGTTGTKENYDFHACGNVTDTDEGALFGNIQYWLKEAGNRTVTCSEYMNYFGHPYTQWSGIDNSLANDIAVAQIGAEHTEAMRRARIDAILPYMYAGWTRTRLEARVRERGTGSAIWKAGYASPLSAAWHSSLSPVLASLDLFNPNYLTGQEVITDLYLINDSWHDAKIQVDILLTKESPEYIPEADCFNYPVKQWSLNATIKADTVEKTQINWQLPEEEGSYWLTARLTGIEGRPVLSQRFVRAVNAPVSSEKLRQRTLILIGADEQAKAFFQTMKLQTQEVFESGSMIQLEPEKHTVVIWNASRVTAEEKRLSGKLCDFADRGGQIIVLSTPSWNWRDLCEVRINHDPRFSRVFPTSGLSGFSSAHFDPQWLIRWNGLPGTVAYGKLEGDVMKQAKKVLWARDPETVVMALIPAVSGKGKILFSQLNVQNLVNKTDSNYDPVAARLLLGLLEGDY